MNVVYCVVRIALKPARPNLLHHTGDGGVAIGFGELIDPSPAKQIFS
jgi:hypothetical protein